MTITVSTADLRSCKALALLEGAEQWLKIRRKSDGVKFYVIPGSQGRVYWTNYGECSCPDSRHRGVECKHITAVKLHCAKVRAERPGRRSHPLVDGGAAHLQVMRAAAEWSVVPAEVAANAAAYHSIFGRDVSAATAPRQRVACLTPKGEAAVALIRRDGFGGLAERDRARLVSVLRDLADRYAPRRPRAS